MTIHSLHYSVKGVDEEVRHLNTQRRRLLAVCRKVLTRQSTVFSHALQFGGDHVPFNPQVVAWARKTKLGLIQSDPEDSP